MRLLANRARSSHTNSAMGQCTRWLEILDDLPASAGSASIWYQVYRRHLSRHCVNCLRNEWLYRVQTRYHIEVATGACR